MVMGKKRGGQRTVLQVSARPVKARGLYSADGGEPARKESWWHLRLEPLLLQRSWRDREGRTAAQRPPAQRGMRGQDEEGEERRVWRGMCDVLSGFSLKITE